MLSSGMCCRHRPAIPATTAAAAATSPAPTNPTAPSQARVLDRLIRRAEQRAEREWRDDHGQLPWDLDGLVVWWGAGDPTVHAIVTWPQRWLDLL